MIQVLRTTILGPNVTTELGFPFENTITYPGAGVANLIAGKTIFVDSVYGEDSTGARENGGKPFITLAAAFAVAQSGDVVEVGPGTFAAAMIPAGVSLSLDPSVVINSDNLTPIFDDATGASVANILGDGDLVCQVSTIFSLVQDKSVVTARMRRLTVFDAGGFAIRQTQGSLTLSVPEIVSGTAGVFWWGGGPCDVECFNMTGGNGDYGLISLTPGEALDSNVGQFHLRADTITTSNSNAGVFTVLTPSVESRAWFQANLMQNTDVQNPVMGYGGMRIYVRAEKTKGVISSIIGGGEFYLDVQKHNGMIVQSQPTVSFLNIGFIDDTGVAATNIINVVSGTMTLTGGQFTGSATTLGIAISGGTLLLKNCVIDTSANNGTNPITISGGTLILDNCTLIAHSSRDSITASTSQNVVNYGSRANKAKNVNVTILVQALLVDSAVI